MKHISFLDGHMRDWIQSGFICLGWIVVLGISGCSQKEEPEMVQFDVQEGLAVETLKEAARQADVEFIFSSELVRGIRTPAIEGKYTPFEGFELMLSDLDFVVVQHQQSGVYSIQKTSDR